jgi:Hemerythrin HHE cation binding domain
MALGTLLAHDHSELDAALAELVSGLANGDAARSLDALDLFWARLAVHIRAENLHLFPALLRPAEFGRGSMRDASLPQPEEIRTLVAQLREDHDFFMIELAAAVKQLRALCSSDQRAGLREVRQRINALSRRLDAHNALEESRVYPSVALLLDPPQQLALDKNIRRELENLPSRFGNRTRTNETFSKSRPCE